jgi:hypothetical protein
MEIGSILLFSAWLECFAVFALLCAPADTSARGETYRDGIPIIRIYDLAQIDRETLDPAKQETARIFHKAGVDLRWIRCSGRPADDDSCGRPLAPDEIGVRIFGRSREDVKVTGRRTTGQAVRLVEEGGSGLILIYYECVEAIVTTLLDDCPQMDIASARRIVLGHVMAHEIGHILLSNGDHAVSSIMQPNLDRDAWRKAVSGSLSFNESESRLMRHGIETRAARIRAKHFQQGK